MWTTGSPLTLSLATAFGAFVLAAGVGCLVAREHWQRVMDDFEDSPATTYIAAVVVFLLGTTLILAHPYWTDPLAGFVTLMGWIAAIEGLVLIAFPGPLLALARGFVRPASVAAMGVFCLVFGALLLAAGLLGRVAP